MRYSLSGLRARLWLPVLFAVIPAFALNAYTAIVQRQQAALNAERDATNLVQLAAREQGRLIASTRQLLISLSNLPEVRHPSSVAACHRTLAEVLKPFSYSHRLIGLALPDGNVYCRSSTVTTKVNISDRGYFQRAMQTRDFGIGDYQIGRATLKNSINFGQAVLDDHGNVLTVVFAALDLDWLNQLIATNELPPDSSLTVVDKDGTVLARHPDPQKWVGKDLPNSPLISTILTQSGKGTAEVKGLDGVTRLYAFAPLHDGPIGRVYVSVGLSKEVAFAAANADFSRNLKLLLMVATFAMLLAWLGSDAFVMRRVKALSGAARRLAQGDLSARTGLPHGSEELGQLARAFDNMAVGLQLMTSALQRVNRALKTLSACTRAVVRATEEQALLAELCHTIVRVGGYRCAWIAYAEHDEHKTVRAVAQTGFEDDVESLAALTADVTWADTEQGRGLASTAIRTVKPQVVQHISSDPALTQLHHEAILRGCASGAAFPLAIHGKSLGALTIYSEEPDAFAMEELELLNEAAQDLAFGIATLRTRVEHDQTLEHLAYFDTLTGLPNRASFEQRLRRALPEADRSGQSLALMIIDIDRLWEINDALGFNQGDQLLKDVGVRIQQLFKREVLIARMRGDEFAVLLPVNGGDDASGTAQRILNALREPFTMGDVRLDVSATVGISLFPQHGAEAPRLIRHADVAMHQAKKSGEGYAFYAVENDEDNTKRLALIGELRRAIEKDELVLYYQPKINMRDGHVCGVEALVRWNHPSRGMIPPDEFIPLAEQTGLIKPLTEWVLSAALRQSAHWRQAGLALPIAVNLSARNLHDSELVDKLADLLTAWNAEPHWLELEITEGAVMDDPEGALEILTRLNAMGIPLFIDDFGTGYSSLGYLKKLPVGAMKIDKSFVIDMLTDADSATIVRSTIGLAHDLDLKVVAEGVENRAMWDQLATLGCDVAQGYHMSKPLPAEQLMRFALTPAAGRRAAI